MTAWRRCLWAALPMTWPRRPRTMVQLLPRPRRHTLSASEAGVSTVPRSSCRAPGQEAPAEGRPRTRASLPPAPGGGRRDQHGGDRPPVRAFARNPAQARLGPHLTVAASSPTPDCARQPAGPSSTSDRSARLGRGRRERRARLPLYRQSTFPLPFPLRGAVDRRGRLGEDERGAGHGVCHQTEPRLPGSPPRCGDLSVHEVATSHVQDPAAGRTGPVLPWGRAARAVGSPAARTSRRGAGRMPPGTWGTPPGPGRRRGRWRAVRPPTRCAGTARAGTC